MVCEGRGTASGAMEDDSIAALPQCHRACGSCFCSESSQHNAGWLLISPPLLIGSFNDG